MKKTRREMIKKGLVMAGSFAIVPRHVLGRGHRAPSDKLGLAAIGAGGKGRSDIINAWNKGSENVVALCDIDTAMAAGAVERFPTAKYYHDFRRMLEEMRNDIDGVTISTPDHTHAVAASIAMDLGMHVYVQKPLTHNIQEARHLTEKARDKRIVTQMGNQGASNPGQEQMIAWQKAGLIGDVHTVHVWTNRPVWPQGIPAPSETMPLPDTVKASDWDLFVGPADHVGFHSLYHPFKWRGWWNFGTGALGDMGCHLIDPPFRVLGLGYPTEVECSVGQVFTRDWTPEYIPEGCPPSSRVQLRFPANEVNKTPLHMTWHDGGLRPFHPELIPANDYLGEPGSANGVLMIGTKGIMTCGTYGRLPKIYFNDGTKIEMEEDFEGTNKYASEGEYGHQIHWVEACKEGFGSAKHLALTSSFDYAGPLTETVLMGNIAIRTYMLGKTVDSRMVFEGRKKLFWDGVNMKITNFEEANQFVSRPYRSGWKLA